MNSLKELLKGERYCLHSLVTTPYCRIIDSAPKMFSPYGNSVNWAFASSAAVGEKADAVMDRVNNMGCLEGSWEEKKKLWWLYEGTCTPLKCLSFTLFLNMWIFPCLPVTWVGSLYHSESGWVCDSVHNATDRMDLSSFLPWFPCCKASSCLLCRVSSRCTCSCKSRQGDCLHETSAMFANTQSWVILLEYFCFCPDFVWNLGFPLHE